ncbi:UNVERIFIED_CONTAM: hypothetical protein H355_012423 [Colinus virginianus]|nr:hypothetical protein H355_012423 [Colinus virginianus]
MDPDELVQCPYDETHRIRASRLPYHLVKCQRNNPQLARSLAVCPFNARHRIPRAELQRHVACCPDRSQLSDLQELAVCAGDKAERPKAPAGWQAPPCQEDWEAGECPPWNRSVPPPKGRRGPDPFPLYRGGSFGGSCAVYPRHHCQTPAPPRRWHCFGSSLKVEPRCGSGAENRTPHEGSEAAGAE